MKKLLLYLTMATIFSGAGSLLKAHPCPNPTGSYIKSCNCSNPDDKGNLTCQCSTSWYKMPNGKWVDTGKDKYSKNSTINLCGQETYGKKGDVYLYNNNGTLTVDSTGTK